MDIDFHSAFCKAKWRHCLAISDWRRNGNLFWSSHLPSIKTSDVEPLRCLLLPVLFSEKRVLAFYAMCQCECFCGSFDQIHWIGLFIQDFRCYVLILVLSRAFYPRKIMWLDDISYPIQSLKINIRPELVTIFFRLDNINSVKATCLAVCLKIVIICLFWFSISSNTSRETKLALYTSWHTWF